MNSYRAIPRLVIALAMLILASNLSQARFLQSDPVGYIDDLDMYTYVQDDPTDKTDPTGKSVLDYCGTYGCSEVVTRQHPVANESPAVHGTMGPNGKRYSDGRYHPGHNSAFRGGRAHKGIDYPGRKGELVHAMADGTVVRADGTSTDFGNQVVVDHGSGEFTRSGHLTTITVTGARR